MEVTVDNFGRIVIPKAVRDQLGLRPGTELKLEITEEDTGERGISLRPAREQSPLVQKGRALVFSGEPLESTGRIDAVEAVKAMRHDRLSHLGR